MLALGHAEGGEGGVSFLLRLTVAAWMTAVKRLVSTARTTETTYRFLLTGAGAVHADSRAVNCVGAAGRSGISIVRICRTGSAVAD